MLIVLTAEQLTAEQIRDAADRWPEWVTAERSATALGLPERRTSGGLPLYPPPAEIRHAREYIARVITVRHNEEG